MYNWRANVDYNDPNNQREQVKLYQFIKERSQKVETWEEVILNQCRQKSVLDVGGIAHNKRQIKSQGWKHRKIKSVAKKVVGVDILKPTINWINSLGYDFRYCDATSDEFLGEKFEVIHMGDMIEHISNIDGLLKFAKRHLTDDGIILIQTCNPFYYRTICTYFKKEACARDNMEHVCWITPTNMNELCYRADLQYYRTWWQTEKMNALEDKILPIELKAYSYIFELRHSIAHLEVKPAQTGTLFAEMGD